MAGINKAILVGHLGRDPEIRYTAKGDAVANFTLATSERGKDGQDRTEWHRIVAWGRLAEICGEYLAKGKQVYIEGRIQTREWEDREKVKRSTTEIVAQVMQMLGSGGGSRGSRPGGTGSRETPGGSAAEDTGGYYREDNGQSAGGARGRSGGPGGARPQGAGPGRGGGGGRESGPPPADDYGSGYGPDYGPPGGDDEIPF